MPMGFENPRVENVVSKRAFISSAGLVVPIG
jgi:hypothetical protein